MMTPELLKAVIKMRDAQKKFFKSRQGHDLEQARRCEKEVDAMLAKIPVEKAPDLFSPSQR